MSIISPTPKKGIYIGSASFGNYREKSLTVTTWGNGVYLHIKDRTRGKTVTLTSNDFFDILQLKDKISSFLDKGARVVAKQVEEENKQLEQVQIATHIESESSDSDQDMYKVSNKLNGNNKNHVFAKSINRNNLLDIKDKHKKHKKPKHTIDERYSDSDEEKTPHKRNKKVKYNCSESDSEEVSDIELKPKHNKKKTFS